MAQPQALQQEVQLRWLASVETVDSPSTISSSDATACESGEEEDSGMGPGQQDCEPVALEEVGQQQEQQVHGSGTPSVAQGQSCSSLGQPSGSSSKAEGAPDSACAAKAEKGKPLPGAWSFLHAPTQRDLAPKRRRLAFDKPVPSLACLVVMDFEWTADNRRKMLPCAEIIQFPAVLVRFDGKWAPSAVLPEQFDTFVRPRFNPVLTTFSKELCGISQAEVDAAPDFGEVLRRFLAWLQGLGLTAPDGSKDEQGGRWCFATWSDADIGNTLVAQLEAYDLQMPACFSDWVDLRSLFVRHYKHGPRGGLRRCVEHLGLKFEGRAHNGLVDAYNTARLAAHMARDGFIFQRATRGINPKSGRMFGAR